MNTLPGFTGHASLEASLNKGRSSTFSVRTVSQRHVVPAFAIGDHCTNCWLSCAEYCLKNPNSTMCIQCRNVCAHICRWYG